MLQQISDDEYLIESDSQPGVWYKLKRRYGQWTCNCIGFTLTCLKRGSNCKHLNTLFALHPELNPEFHEQPMTCDQVRIRNPLGEILSGVV